MATPVLNFKFGRRSLALQREMADDLAFVMHKALTGFTTVDFGYTQAIRTIEQQRVNVKTKKSKTMNSRHIPYVPVTPHKYPRAKPIEGPLAHAVDIMAYINGKGTWKASAYYEIAQAVRLVAIRYDVAIRWGGCWQDLRKVKDIRQAVDAYIERCKRANKKPLIDLCHYELAAASYPKKVA